MEVFSLCAASILPPKGRFWAVNRRHAARVRLKRPDREGTRPNIQNLHRPKSPNEVNGVPNRARAEQRLRAAMLNALAEMDDRLRHEPLGLKTTVMRVRVRILRARVMVLHAERKRTKRRWRPSRRVALLSLAAIAATGVGVMATVWGW